MNKTFYENVLMPAADFATGTRIMDQLRYWRSISALPANDLNELANKNLNNILKYSSDVIPYYSQLNLKQGPDPEENLRRFPVMKKSNIRDHLDALIAPGAKGLIKYSSSGSSGIQGSVFMNKKEQSVIRAIMLLWWEWAGYTMGQKTIQTGITPERGFVKDLKDRFLNVEYVSAFNISETEVLKTLDNYQNTKNLFFAGYPSSLNVFAEVALKHLVRDVHFDSAICWGDKLFDHYKKNAKEAFGCDAKEVYSCNEGFLVAAKKDIDYFYIMSPHVYVEIVDKDFNPVPDGEMGYVLLTRLDCYSMPLIRYYVGDLAVKLPLNEYPEKRDLQFPLLKRVIGRDTDIVVTSSGKRLIVHFFTGIFEFFPEIVQFMVIQKELESIEIEYIAGPGFTPGVLSKLENVINSKLKEKIKIFWRQVDCIPPTASGKPQLIQSFIGKQ
jgi:phenylacetate-CoA ligase